VGAHETTGLQACFYKKGKEQPDKKSRLFAGVMRKTAGLSYRRKRTSHWFTQWFFYAILIWFN
jgi:hypothetical protein